MMFWLAAAALVALALGFAVWPLIGGRGAGRSAADRAVAMRALYRDRRAELEAEAAAGRLDAETRSQVLDELGANLLEELGPEAPASSSAPGRRAAGCCSDRPGPPARRAPQNGPA